MPPGRPAHIDFEMIHKLLDECCSVQSDTANQSPVMNAECPIGHPNQSSVMNAECPIDTANQSSVMNVVCPIGHANQSSVLNAECPIGAR